MSEVYLTELVFFYNYIYEDSVYHGNTLLSGTEEVMQTTHIDTDKDRLTELASDESCTHLKTPAGIFTEVTLPVDDIKYGHENDTLSGARVVFQCMNQTDAEAFGEPEYVLMLPKDSLYSFFENKNIPNNTTSFIGTYNSSNNTYTFNNISNLITHMYNVKKNGTKSEDWNKAVLVPVAVSTTSSSSGGTSSITNVTNEMSLKSAKLVGGSSNPYDPITISVIYSRTTKQ